MDTFLSGFGRVFSVRFGNIFRCVLDPFFGDFWRPFLMVYFVKFRSAFRRCFGPRFWRGGNAWRNSHSTSKTISESQIMLQKIAQGGKNPNEKTQRRNPPIGVGHIMRHYLPSLPP